LGEGMPYYPNPVARRQMTWQSWANATCVIHVSTLT
jgi:hypothetical protein